MTPCNQYDDDWERLQLGALDEERSAEMRAHVTGCPTCRVRWNEATRMLGALGTSLDEIEPPAHVELSLRRRLRAESAGPANGRTAQVSPQSGAWWKLAGVAAAVAVVVTGTGLAVQNVSLRRGLAETERQRASAGAAVARLQDQLSQLSTGSVPPPVASTPAPAPMAPQASGVADRARWEIERARLAEEVMRAEAARGRADTEIARLTAALADARRQASSSPPVVTPPPRAAAAGDDEERRRIVELEDTIARLTTEVRRLEAEGQRQAGLTREYASALQVALDDRTTRVTLRAVDPAAGKATASATVTPDGRLVLMARGLPPLAADKCYQLWVIRRDNPAIVSAGVLGVNSLGQALHSARVSGTPGQITGFALTDEPLGGSEVSRGRKLLFGAVN